MGDLRAFDLQEYIDYYNCLYYVESGGSEDTIEYALHFPFKRIYTIDHRTEITDQLKQRFWFNNRVQVFSRVHDTAFYELARMVPNEYSAVIWLSDHYLPQNLDQLSKIRPAKKDVIIVDSNRCCELADIMYLHKYFGLTHSIHNAMLGKHGKGLVLAPLPKQAIA